MVLSTFVGKDRSLFSFFISLLEPMPILRLKKEKFDPAILVIICSVFFSGKSHLIFVELYILPTYLINERIRSLRKKLK